ncbi:MAG: nucleotidyl transferase AbiEii/AbiGii toxin family protein [Spirochaetes bacterium]|nr:nucleotidyl transferase AbiEii/AbiGii toxin family protein [Spirochaetota bacterium]
MLHNDKDKFLSVLQQTSAQTGFPLRLLEKDYYLTLILDAIHELSTDLIFKGGTCLSKIYFNYYRLSEDLDFSINLPTNDINRSKRRQLIKPIKEGIDSFFQKFDMKIDPDQKVSFNLSRQYIYYFYYHSILLNKEEPIKFEIGLRFKPIMPIKRGKIQHKFIHPFTKKLLFDTGEINCLSLNELIAEKMRATATRRIIAPRDFFDLGYLLKKKINIFDKDILKLFQIKLKEDNFKTDLKSYKNNLGRTDKEIDDMKSRIEAELLDVLPMAERKKFNIDKILDAINKNFQKI